MEVIIRPPNVDDASAINEIRRMDGVRENTLGLISEPVSRNVQFLQNLDRNNHMLVAEVDGKVVGMASLMQSTHPRMNHTGSIGISVHRDFQSKGVGRKLMEALIDIADNWLMLVRIELGVIEDNKKARSLYESLGFVKEGVKRMSIIRGGRYCDEIMMSRIKVAKQLRDFK
ncbi:GNAT family N-acetyltransferase [Fusibacter sp. JL216-2]|uniref:GNAT family N-acetyltransferase n=1 Tax=Fusibacter sp. JL216-2 TaxID=3071453 RepID=UPI003D34169D